MTIRELIEENTRRINLLQRHNTQLEQMLVELDGQTQTPRRKRKYTPRAGGPTARIEKFLRDHPGPQNTREIAAHLDCTATEVHTMIRNGLNSELFARGPEPATFMLGPRALREVKRAEG